MTTIHIPPAALEAGARALCVAREGNDEWWTLHMRAARAAFVAMVEAWEGMQLSCLTVEVPGRKIILPLMEKPDDKA